MGCQTGAGSKFALIQQIQSLNLCSSTLKGNSSGFQSFGFQNSSLGQDSYTSCRIISHWTLGFHILHPKFLFIYVIRLPYTFVGRLVIKRVSIKLGLVHAIQMSTFWVVGGELATLAQIAECLLLGPDCMYVCILSFRHAQIFAPRGLQHARLPCPSLSLRCPDCTGGKQSHFKQFEDSHDDTLKSA